MSGDKTEEWDMRPDTPRVVRADQTGMRDPQTGKLVVGNVTFGPDKTPLDPNRKTPVDQRTMAQRSAHPEPLPLMPEKRPDSQKEKLGDGADGGGKRMNAGKNRMELTLAEWDWALADVSTKGSYKYDEWNWLLGMKWSSMIGCMKRHIAKFEAGERYDGKEFNIEKGTTGCHHLAMVAWNALALMTYDIREIGEDDRATMVDMQRLLARVNAETSDMEISDGDQD